MNRKPRPKSVTHFGICLVGLASMLITYYFLRQTMVSVDGDLIYTTHEQQVISVIVLVLATMLPVVLLEMIFLKTHASQQGGLNWSRRNPLSWRRIGYKILALLATFGAIGALYWMLPLFDGNEYPRFYTAIELVFPTFALLALPYVILVDMFMVEPEDEYYHIGRALLGDRSGVNRPMLAHHARSWGVKAFFLPLMISFLSGNLSYTLVGDFDWEGAALLSMYHNLFLFLYLVDLVFGVAGYVFTFRLFGTNIKTVEPTMLGWTVCLICYPPMWDFVSRSIISYERDNVRWYGWLEPGEPMFFVFMAIVLVLSVIYALATVIFGVRFSNLTNRGIITGGPYRWTKHPAYLSKNLSWWFIGIPFVPVIGWDIAFKSCIGLLLVNFVYYLRAITEERHLSKDPAYVEYALWMEAHGPMRWLGKLLPILKYKAPATK